MNENDRDTVPDLPSATKRPRGFTVLPREQVIEIARKGGLAAQATGRAYRWTSEQAREAGRKGAASRAAKRVREVLGRDPSQGGV